MPSHWDPDGYYEALELSTDATAEEIRRAYRRLAKREHPDRNPGDLHASERFQAIQNAYDVLSDATRRAAYDARPWIEPDELDLGSVRTDDAGPPRTAVLHGRFRDELELWLEPDGNDWWTLESAFRASATAVELIFRGYATSDLETGRYRDVVSIYCDDQIVALRLQASIEQPEAEPLSTASVSSDTAFARHGSGSGSAARKAPPRRSQTLVAVAVLSVALAVVLPIAFLTGGPSASERAVRAAAHEPGIQWAIDGTDFKDFPHDDSDETNRVYLRAGRLFYISNVRDPIVLAASNGHVLERDPGEVPTRHHRSHTISVRSYAVDDLRLQSGHRWGLVARDPDSHVRWRRLLDRFQPPTVLAVGRDRVLVAFDANHEHSHILALDASTGTTLWRASVPHDASAISARSGRRYALVRIQLNDPDGTSRYARLDAQTGRISMIRWPKHYYPQVMLGPGGPRDDLMVVECSVQHEDYVLGSQDLVLSLASGQLKPLGEVVPDTEEWSGQTAFVQAVDEKRVIVLLPVGDFSSSKAPDGYVLESRSWKGVQMLEGSLMVRVGSRCGGCEVTESDARDCPWSMQHLGLSACHCGQSRRRMT